MGPGRRLVPEGRLGGGERRKYTRMAIAMNAMMAERGSEYAMRSSYDEVIRFI